MVTTHHLDEYVVHNHLTAEGSQHMRAFISESPPGGSAMIRGPSYEEQNAQ
jgi:hypothetical protein